MYKPQRVFSKYPHKNLGLTIAEYYSYERSIVIIISWLMLKALQSTDDLIPVARVLTEVFKQVKPTTEIQEHALSFLVGAEYSKLYAKQTQTTFLSIIKYGLTKSGNESPEVAYTLEEWTNLVSDNHFILEATTPPEDLSLKSSLEILD